MIKLKNLLSNNKGHISNHHPAHAFAPTLSEADEDSVSAADEKQAKRLKKPLTKSIADIARSMDNINTAMSDFNAPGLKHAFTDALRIALKRQGKFDERAAFKRLENYYKDR